MSTDYQIRINKMNCELMLTYDTPAYMFNVYKNQPSRQTGSRNLMGPKTLTTIWGTYMKLVIKQDVARYVVLRIPPLVHLCQIWFILKQQWTIEEISIFSNSSHLKWRAGLSDTFLEGTHPETIPARFGLIWFSSFRGEDLNVIFYQIMPNLHNRYKSAERKISQKKTEYMLNYS
jgi:hypothetical protein